MKKVRRDLRKLHTQSIIDWVLSTLTPDFHINVSLRSTPQREGNKLCLAEYKVTAEEIDNRFNHLINRTSKLLYGRRYYDNLSKGKNISFKCFATVEDDFGRTFPHIHAVCQKPDDRSFDEIKNALILAMKQMGNWCHIYKIEEIEAPSTGSQFTGQSGGLTYLNYIIKEKNKVVLNDFTSKNLNTLKINTDMIACKSFRK